MCVCMICAKAGGCLETVKLCTSTIAYKKERLAILRCFDII